MMASQIRSYGHNYSAQRKKPGFQKKKQEKVKFCQSLSIETLSTFTNWKGWKRCTEAAEAFDWSLPSSRNLIQSWSRCHGSPVTEYVHIFAKYKHIYTQNIVSSPYKLVLVERGGKYNLWSSVDSPDANAES